MDITQILGMAGTAAAGGLPGLILGGVARVIPMLADIWTKKSDNDHEYRMTQLQLELGKQTADIDAKAKAAALESNLAMAQADIDRIVAQSKARLDEIDASALADAVKDSLKPTGIRWVDAANASMRPFAFYWHCVVLYSLHKLALLVVGWNAKLGLQDLAPLLYTEVDAAVFCSIMGFIFMDRALRNGRLQAK